MNILLLCTSFITLVLPILCNMPTASDVITACLTCHNIKNFTTFPNSGTDSSEYYKLLNFSLQNLRFAEPSFTKPAAIILPESRDELVRSVECCRKGSWGIRVRCGGHSYEGTSSVTTDGDPFVIIDMMNLNKISVDLESEVAWVEGGATIGELYHAIAELSNCLGFSAGSCPTVGSGGHISGGGFGLLSRKYGLAADNVIDALLVDAEGRLLDREAMGEDVFWAIRGGGGGIWGIIYAWKIKLLRVPEVVTSFVVSRPGSKHDVAELVHKWQFVAPNLDGSFYLSSFVGAGLPETKTIGMSATFKGFYLGSKSEALSIISHVFPELGVMEDDCKEMSWIESVVFFSGLGEGCSVSELKNRYLLDKKYFKAKSDYVKTTLSLNGVTTLIDMLEEKPKGYVILDPYGGIMQNISSEAIAFPHRKGNIFSVQYLVEWYEVDHEKGNEYLAWMRKLYDAMTPFVSSGPRAAYINYMDLDLGVMDLVSPGDSSGAEAVELARAWGEKYFLKNYDRLVRAKTYIDPNNLFKHQQGIPPMLTSGSK